MMRISCIALFAAATLGAAGLAQAGTELVYFGSTGVPPPGRFPTFTLPSPKDGVYAGWFDDSTGTIKPIGQVAQLLRPSMMLANPDKPIVYAVNELGGDGSKHAQLVTFRYDARNGSLQQAGVADTGGAGTNFVSLDAKSGTFFAASYASGNVTTLVLNADGTAGSVVANQQHTGKGATFRQTGPHAHAAVLDPSGRFVLAPDLGTDRVYVYRFDAASRELSPAAQPSIAFPAGSGPRHLVFLPGGKFVIVNSEMSAQLFVLAWDSERGSLSFVQTVDLQPADARGMKSAADMALSPDGRTLYVCNRSDTSIDSFRVDAATGRLTALERVAAGGRTPWSLSIDPSGHWLLVADNGSNQVVTFRIGADGRISATGVTVDVLSPSSILFAGG